MSPNPNPNPSPNVSTRVGTGRIIQWVTAYRLIRRDGIAKHMEKTKS